MMHNNPHTLSPDPSFGVFNVSSGTFILPALPFETNALVPVTGPETLSVHLGKHHQAYIDAANALLSPLEKRFSSASEVVAFARDTGAHALLEQSGQALNHAFFWTCQQAAGLTRPKGDLEIALNATFSDFDGFLDAALKIGKSRVGSGWIWLLADSEGTLSLAVTEDAETLLDAPTHVALLVCDIWEHAYYLDHKSDRPAWIKGFFGQLADWSLAESRYEMVKSMEPIAA
jgi:superoxide dismutase, Fe-Mn family